MKKVLFGLILLLSACKSENNNPTPAGEAKILAADLGFDWQGHRGARGIAPENTVPAFLKALSYPVQTLELDVVISRDRAVVVSHEPWLSPTICIQADGSPLEGEEQAYKIMEMSYSTIATYNCGQAHPRFPQQTTMEVNKPLLANVVQAVQQFCSQQDRPMPFFNIEIKSSEKWDNVLTPTPEVFAEIVIAEIRKLEISKQVCIQSFDPRSLEAVHKQAPDLVTAFLVESPGDYKRKLKQLSFQPEIYSPYYPLVSKPMLEDLHAKGIKVIPWTVNEKPIMDSLIQLGVDGIITDYPNLISKPR